MAHESKEHITGEMRMYFEKKGKSQCIKLGGIQIKECFEGSLYHYC